MEQVIAAIPETVIHDDSVFIGWVSVPGIQQATFGMAQEGFFHRVGMQKGKGGGIGNGRIHPSEFTKLL